MEHMRCPATHVVAGAAVRCTKPATHCNGLAESRAETEHEAKFEDARVLWFDIAHCSAVVDLGDPHCCGIYCVERDGHTNRHHGTCSHGMNVAWSSR